MSPSVHMDPRSARKNSFSSHDFMTEFQQASGDFFSSQNNLQALTQQYGHQPTVSSYSPAEFRPSPAYSLSSGLQQSVNHTYKSNFSDRNQSVMYQHQQQYGSENFYPSHCPPANYQQHYGSILQSQSPTPSLPTSQPSPQLSPVQLMQQQQNAQISIRPPGHGGLHQKAQFHPGYGKPQQQNNEQSSPARIHHQSNLPMGNAGNQYYPNQCAHRNDPPMGNMHTRANPGSLDIGMPYASGGYRNPNSFSAVGSGGKSNNNEIPVNFNSHVTNQMKAPSSISQTQYSSYASPSLVQHTATSVSSVTLLQGRPTQSRLTHSRPTQSGISSKTSQDPQIIAQTVQQKILQSLEVPVSSNSSSHSMAFPGDDRMMQIQNRRPSMSNTSNERTYDNHGSTRPPYSVPNHHANIGNVPYSKSYSISESVSRSAMFVESLAKIVSSNNVTVTSANPFSVFSMAPSARGMRGSRARAGITRGRGRGSNYGRIGGRGTATQIGPNERAHPVQWFKCPESLLASSFQSDIEAMQADAATYLSNIRAPEVAPTAPDKVSSVPNRQQHLMTQRPAESYTQSISQTSEPRISQSTQSSEHQSGLKDSRAAALATIQIKQEMADNLSKSKFLNKSQATTDIIPNMPTKSAAPQDNSIVKSSESSVQSSTSSGNTLLSSRPSASHLKCSALTSSVNAESDSRLDGSGSSANLSNQSQHGKNANQFVPYLPTSVFPSISVSLPTKHAQTACEKGSGQRQDESFDRRSVTARDKVFDLWKSGQVVGRCPVTARGRGRGRGRGNVTVVQTNPLASSNTINTSERTHPGTVKSNSENMQKHPTSKTDEASKQESMGNSVKHPNTKSGSHSQFRTDLRYVMFHGHKLICLKSPQEARLLLCQFQFECFPDKGMGSINNCLDRALRIKKKLLDHPRKDKLISYLRKNGYPVESSVQTINLDDARRVYHYMYGILNCSNATCVVELPHQSVDLDTVVPKKRTRDIIVRVKKEKKSADDKNYGKLHSSSGTRYISDTALRQGMREVTLSSGAFMPQNQRDCRSPASDGTLPYGDGPDSSDQNDLIIMEASEDPHVIHWNDGEPKTGGLCNTIAGQLRSYRYKDENYLVVDDLCRIFGHSEFTDGVEKENIILYSCCQEIGDFLSAISSNFPPLESLRHSLVKEKDIGVHVTDNNYVPVQTDSNQEAFGNAVLKRSSCKQEIIDDDEVIVCKQARLDGNTKLIESVDQGMVDAAEHGPEFRGQSYIQSNDFAGLASTELPRNSAEIGGLVENMPNHVSENSSGRSLAVLNKNMNEESTAAVSTAQVAEVTSLNTSASSLELLSPVISDRPTRISCNLDNVVDTVNGRAQQRPHSASSPESICSAASQEAEASPPILSDQGSPGTMLSASSNRQQFINESSASSNHEDHLEIPQKGQLETAGCPAETHVEKEGVNIVSSSVTVELDLPSSPKALGDRDQTCMSSPNSNSLRANALKLRSMLLETRRNSAQSSSRPPSDNCCEPPTSPTEKALSAQDVVLTSKPQSQSGMQSLTPSVTSTDSQNQLSEPYIVNSVDSSVVVDSPSTFTEGNSDSISDSTVVSATLRKETSDHANEVVHQNCDSVASEVIEIIDNSAVGADNSAIGTVRNRDDKVHDNSDLMLVDGFRVKVVTKSETEDSSYSLALSSQLSSLNEASAMLPTCGLPQPVCSGTSVGSSRRSSLCPVSSASSSSLPSLSKRHRSLDDMDVMDSSSIDPLAAPPSSSNSSREFLLHANAKLRKQNSALLGIVHILRKELVSAKAGRDKAEKVSKYYEGVIHDITSTFKNGDEEAPIVIEDDCEYCQTVSDH